MSRHRPASKIPTRRRRQPGAGHAGSWSGLSPGVVLAAFLGIAVTIQSSSAAPLEWQAMTGGRSVPVTPVGTGRPGFTSLPPAATGIHFTNQLALERSITNHILLNGAGVAAGDVDGDGWCDLYFCGLDNPNVLYRNLGNWKFEDITERAGVTAPGLDATGAVLVDADGDDDLDLLVGTVGQGVRLFLNDGKGRFTEITVAAGLTSTSGAMSLALADIEGDGDLDLYVTNYRTWTMRDHFSLRLRAGMIGGRQAITMVNGRPVTEPDLVGRFTIEPRGGLSENGEADMLYRNDGPGRFTALSLTNAPFRDVNGQPLREALYDWGLTAAFRDLNGDGAPDLYVCNDLGSPDRIWLNDGRGGFKAAPWLTVRHTSWFSMGIDFADVNRDGRVDFFVADMLSRDHARRHTQNTEQRENTFPPGALDDRPQYPRNTLFLNQGDGDFTEVAGRAGVTASDWSWSPVFLDVDLDGFEDLLITTGFERDVQDIDIAAALERERTEQRLSEPVALRRRLLFPRLEQPNVAFRNRGDLTFADASDDWGFNLNGISHGMCLADLDNDGDLDVAINNFNTAASVLRNDASAPRLSVRLRGTAPNTRGIGASIAVTDLAGTLPMQTQEMMSGGRYLSGDDSVRSFAAGHVTNEFTIEVTWRAGTRTVARVGANRIVELSENGAVPIKSSIPAAIPLFEDVSGRLRHRHVDEPFNDFAREPLLPRRLSQLGPGLAWFDLDGDGSDDLIVPSGRGGQTAIFRNDGHGGFSLLPARGQPVVRDQTTILGLATAGGRSLLAGAANYEDGNPLEPAVQFLNSDGTPGQSVVPATPSSAGALALADVDRDGSLDLFVGGRVVSGRYPEPATSRLLRQVNAGWQSDASNQPGLNRLGLITGAIFTDLDTNGWADLVLASEWGPLRLFRNDRGRLVAWDPAVRMNSGSNAATAFTQLSQLTGFWNGVATGDFDGDGRPDLLAANWGRNSHYEAHREQPLRLYHGELDGDGQLDVIEAYFDERSRRLVPRAPLERLGESLHLIRSRFNTYTKYSQADLPQLLGNSLAQARELQATWLDTTLFLNRGDSLEVRPLPRDAQLAPAFGVIAADVDGDGHTDAFLSQNFFGNEPRTVRDDSGRGLWLRGDGRGGLTAWSAMESGVRVYGEGRGAAAADFDGDGRIDFAVAQNGTSTRLFRNTGGKPGLRIRLRGTPANPDAIGAAFRLRIGDTAGPLQEIQAGSGYWSQNGNIRIVPIPAQAAQVWVRWPDGKTSEHPVPAGSRTLTIEAR